MKNKKTIKISIELKKGFKALTLDALSFCKYFVYELMTLIVILAIAFLFKR